MRFRRVGSARGARRVGGWRARSAPETARQAAMQATNPVRACGPLALGTTRVPVCARLATSKRDGSRVDSGLDDVLPSAGRSTT